MEQEKSPTREVFDHAVLVPPSPGTAPDPNSVPPGVSEIPASTGSPVTRCEAPWKANYEIGDGFNAREGIVMKSAVIVEGADDLEDYIETSVDLCTTADTTSQAFARRDSASILVYSDDPFDKFLPRSIKHVGYSPTSFSIVIRWTCVRSPKDPLRFKLSAAALEDVRDTKKFVSQYGEYFVAGSVGRAEFSAVINCYCDSSDRRDTLLKSAEKSITATSLFSPEDGDVTAPSWLSSDGVTTSIYIEVAGIELDFSPVRVSTIETVYDALASIRKIPKIQEWSGQDDRTIVLPTAAYLVPYSAIHIDRPIPAIKPLADLLTIQNLALDCAIAFEVLKYRDQKLWSDFEDVVYTYRYATNIEEDEATRGHIQSLLETLRARVDQEVQIYDLWTYLKDLKRKQSLSGYDPAIDSRNFRNIEVEEHKPGAPSKKSKIEQLSVPGDSESETSKRGTKRVVGWRSPTKRDSKILPHKSILAALNDVELPGFSTRFGFMRTNATLLVVQDPYLDELVRDSDTN